MTRDAGALADPTRRKILERLARGAARVTDVAAGFPIALNSVSKHIKLLERADLVECRVVGRDHHLRVALQPFDELADWVESKRSSWKAQLVALDDELRREPAAEGKPPKKRRAAP